MNRLGLRARITLTFVLGAMLLAAMLSAITYGLTREILLRQRDASAVNRVFSNAIIVRGDLSTTTSDPAGFDTLLASLPTPEGAQPVIYSAGRAQSRNSVEFPPDAIPSDLQTLVASGQPGRMRVEFDGEPYLIVGVPIPGIDAAYFEGVPLTETRSVLSSLATSLLGAAVITTILGGLIGFWASRRAVAPLGPVGEAAAAIAEGRLDTRLADTGDPDLDRLTTSFNEMASALDARIQRDARFASEVSHELRSPLMTLSASVEVLQNSRDELPERAQTALDLMRADIERFQQLVEDLLEISRFDIGAVTLHLEEVPVTEMVLQAVHFGGGDAVPLRYDEEADDVVVAVDKRRFSRAVVNLLDNARKYAGGATSVRIELARSEPGQRDADRVRICVEDAGHGVPLAEREAIFDRFSRGIEGGNRGADTGVGLGLALVAELVRIHGGEVWVEDRHDGRGGARFVVELPVVATLPHDHADVHDDALPEPDEEFA